MSTRLPLVCSAAAAVLAASPAHASTPASTITGERLDLEYIRVLYRPSPMRRPAHATAADFLTRLDFAVVTAAAGLATAAIIGTWLETPTWAHDLERTAVTLTIQSDGRFDLVVENDPNWLLLRLERFGDATTTQDGATATGS